MKKIIAILMAATFVFALVGCTPSEKEPITSIVPTEPGTEAPVVSVTPENNVDLSVAVVVAGGLGDRSFYDSAATGVEKLAVEYGVRTTIIECKEDASMYQTQLVNAAQSFDFVVAVGWQFGDVLATVAPSMPDTKFIYVDEAVEGISNILNIKYAQNEGSFLVGYIAAKMSKTNKVGAVGGMDNETINDFIAGYKQGALYANPECDVKVVYAGEFEDPAKGKESALSLYDQGCDIVFQIAGKTGEGVFEAAQEKEGCYAIGVDSDQKYINPEVIICSMKKEVGNSIYEAIKKFIENGEFAGGTTVVTNLENGFVGVGYGDDTMTQQVPAELKAEVEGLIAKIISGEIVVDTTRA